MTAKPSTRPSPSARPCDGWRPRPATLRALDALLSVTVLLLLASMPLLQGCATHSSSVTVAPVPPLSQESRQPPPNPICDPTCSERLRLDYEAWREKLMRAAPPAPAASASTAR